MSEEHPLILVVDDDRLVLATLVAGLKQAGFEVIGKGPDSLKARIAEEVPKWKALEAETGIKAS